MLGFLLHDVVAQHMLQEDQKVLPMAEGKPALNSGDPGCLFHPSNGAGVQTPRCYTHKVRRVPAPAFFIIAEVPMSGHSKWATIKHKKGALDAKRGKIFTRLIREITISAKGGGGDPDGNPRLRTAILAAKAENMPQENIKRAIQRGTGELEGVNYEEITFEGYGPGGVAIIVEVLTDNRNRAVSEIRHAFSKNGGNLGETGSVRFMFSKRA